MIERVSKPPGSTTDSESPKTGGDAVQPHGTLGPFYALRFRNFRLFFFGQLVSVAGSWMQGVAQQWLVFDLTHSAAWLGIVAGASAVPYAVTALFGGLAADRFPRRRILLVTQGAAMTVAVILALLATNRWIPIEPWHIAVIAGFSGVVNAFNMPAQQALVPGLVAERAALGNAIALNSLMFNMAQDGHLDIGPGTGYCIERSGLPDGSHVTILDPNPNVLRHTARKLARFDVTAVEADVLKPLPVDGSFESAGMNMVIHCLPGPMSRKALAVRNIAEVLSPTGTFFGATILGRSVDHSWLARRVLSAFNWHGGFDNLDDSEAGLREILEASFERVDIQIVESAAIFQATRPRPRAG